MALLFGSLFTSFLITFFAIPPIIKIAEIKHLFDEPGERKTHSRNVPTLGGLAIFAGMIFSMTFWSTQKDIIELQYILSSTLILFFLGMKDDLFNLVAYKKLVGQIAAAFILVHWADIRITSFFGLFGIDELSIFESYVFSILTMIVITNSVNLIDGIDCLAGTIGVIAALTFGSWFYFAGQTQYVVLSASLLGSLVGFLFYNKSPSRIFMGDTGSLIVGVVLSIFAIKFIEMNRVLPPDHFNKIFSVPVMTLAILVIPLFDTLRVFSMRILQGRSPFSADRNHIHHLLLDLGFTHVQSTALLVTFNVLAIGSIYLLQAHSGELLLTSLLFVCVALSSFVAYLVRKKTMGRVSQTFAAGPGKNLDKDQHIQ